MNNYKLTKKGEIVNIFGTRDEEGLPELVKQIHITDEIGEEYIFFYDDYKRIEKIIADNGTVFNYEWLHDEKVVLHIDCNDGETQINTEIELGDLDPYTTEPTTTSKIRNSIGSSTDIRFSPFIEEEPDLVQDYRGSTGTPYDLITTLCGAPTNGFSPYYVAVGVPSLPDRKKLVFQHVGTGHYRATVPLPDAPIIPVKEMAEKLNFILTYYCEAEGLLGNVISPASCAYVAAALSSTGVGVSVAPAVGGACVGATAALKIYCATFGKSVGTGAPSTADKIIESEFWTAPLNLTFTVYFNGLGSGKNNVYPFNITQGVPKTFSIELGVNNEPRIGGVVLSPSAPSAGQNYIINANIFCAPVGSTVYISMVGSDGWTQNSDFAISDPSQINGQFTMTVPGGDEGVRDEVTVQIKTADGQTVTRYASLIFGD